MNLDIASMYQYVKGSKFRSPPSRDEKVKQQEEVGMAKQDRLVDDEGPSGKAEEADLDDMSSSNDFSNMDEKFNNYQRLDKDDETLAIPFISGIPSLNVHGVKESSVFLQKQRYDNTKLTQYKISTTKLDEAK